MKRAGDRLANKPLIIQVIERIPSSLIREMRQALFSFKNKELVRNQILEIAKYTNEPYEQAESIFNNKNLPNETWQKANPKTEKEILQYYATTRSFIYSNMRQNVIYCAKYNSRFILLDFCKRWQIRKILDYGASTGEYCIFLAQHGFKVSYCDVYGETWKFAQWRFKNRNLNIEMLKPEDKPSEKFHLIVCAEVLAHVKDPPSLLERFYDELVPGGILAATWIESARARAHANDASQHLKENEKYDATMFAILEKIGFRKVCENHFQFLQKSKP
jgi:2-polyprenyl-3-methyl-5-hydroxy-6-metoxy-1,4-benzoquinol methylase